MGMFIPEMSSDSFKLLGMTERGMLPEFLAKRSRHGMILEFIAFVRLRMEYPAASRPCRIPEGIIGAVLMCIPPTILICVVFSSLDTQNNDCEPHRCGSWPRVATMSGIPTERDG